MRKLITRTSALIAFSAIIFGCDKDDNKETVPVVSTAEVTEITANTAISGGHITDNGKTTVTARGVCWSTDENPTIDDNKSEDGPGTGSYSSIITGLEPYTTYFVRAYASYGAGVVYGSTVTFTTQPATGIRPLIHFTTIDIPGFDDMIQTRNGDTPWSVENILQDKYIARYEFRWKSADNTDQVYFIVRITESKEQAVKTLEEMQKWYTARIMQDTPALVGDFSFFNGNEFIRENHIVRIHASEKFKEQIIDIAKYIDQEILKSQAFASIEDVQPVIDEFNISNNPVLAMSKTPLTVQVSDPNNRNNIFIWRFKPNSDRGSIVKDDSGNYYYQAYWVDSEIGLTLIAVNDYGFCANSTIYIKTIKE